MRRIEGRAGAEGEPDAQSAVCRVRGRTWVVLSAADSPQARIEVLGEALRGFEPGWLEARYLPPALRAVLDRDEEDA